MNRTDQDNMTDYPVIELARGVDLTRLPSGEGRRLLTRVLEEVIRTGDHRLMLSEVQDYVVVNGLDVGLTPMRASADTDAADSHRDMIRQDRVRIGEHARANGHKFN